MFLSKNSTRFMSKRAYRAFAWLLISAGVALGLTFVYLGEVWLPQELEVYKAEASSVEIVTVDKSAERLAEKIDALKDDVVAEIEKCESAGHPEEAGIIIFDTNNRASIGVLQFQKRTVQHYYKTLYEKEITGQEAVVIAITPETARSLAKDVMFKVEDGWKNWLNCGNKIGAATKIKYIKELEK